MRSMHVMAVQNENIILINILVYLVDCWFLQSSGRRLKRKLQMSMFRACSMAADFENPLERLKRLLSDLQELTS